MVQSYQIIWVQGVKMSNQKDYFAHKAKEYETESRRVDNVENIANGILQSIAFEADMNIMDFGSGTGLLTSKIAPYVSKITCIDMSSSMNEVLNAKRDSYPCELEILKLDLSTDTLDREFDSIISSMTLHHLRDIEALFAKFYSMLHSGGTIALADLDTEDGSFHTEDTGVFHFGFDREHIMQIAQEAGFTNLNIESVSVASKPHGDYTIFLLTAQK